MKAFEIVLPGFFTTIQDLGRRGLQMYGVPVSGAMDRRSLRIANMLVGNDENEACLEITVYGLEIKAFNDVTIAITGGNLDPLLNGKIIPMWQPIRVKKGDVISFRSLQSGFRAYLAISGGVEVPEIMGSKSTYITGKFGGIDGRALRRGDIIEIREPNGDILKTLARKLPEELIPNYKNEAILKVVMGPQDDLFTEHGIMTFLSSEYTITPQSDRVGYRLEGPRIECTDYNIISDAIVRGTIQIPGDGMPIILMSDTGTTGGYSKIATIINQDIDISAQLKPGDKVKFTKVMIEEAHILFKNYEKDIQTIKEYLK